MPTSAETVDFLLDQLGWPPNARTRKMFGEYAVYLDEKVVAFVCDDELFVKPTAEGRVFVEAAGALDEAPAYPGSKLYLRIGGDRWENREWLAELMRTTADALPAPKPKAPKSKPKASKSKPQPPKSTSSKPNPSERPKKPGAS